MKMKWWTCFLLAISILMSELVFGEMPTTVKRSILREENPLGGKERLILPYAFSSETMGLTFGAGAIFKGYGQDQLILAATAFASDSEIQGKDDASGVLAGVFDFRIPYTRRLFFTATGAIAYYPRKRAYSAPLFDPRGIRPGGNNSSADQFIEVGGNDNWVDFRLEYVLPIGAAEDNAMMTYKTTKGMLTSRPTGGRRWNPFSSGLTNVLLRQYNRYQSFQLDPGGLENTIHPIQLGIAYDNTDFPINPSVGSRQFLGITRDFGWAGSDETWTFWQLEAAKFFSLGSSDWARQRVLALNIWTGDTPSYNENLLPNGLIKVHNAPPFYEGATLGGFYRMRAYPFYRFNDRSVIYTSAEYRYTPHWNPIGEISWLRFLKMDWWQFAGFIEGGRVAREYKISQLSSDWQSDVGLGIRAMVAGGLIRVDVAFSKEDMAVWFMVGQPF